LPQSAGTKPVATDVCLESFFHPPLPLTVSQIVIIKLQYLNFLGKQALGWYGTRHDPALAGGAEQFGDCSWNLTSKRLLCGDVRS
jgi:hypothetical protein